MARQRDYRAEYRARVERARAAGKTGAAAYGHQKRAEEAKARARQRAAERAARPKPPKKPKRKPKRATILGGRVAVTTTSDPRELLRAVRAAAAAGHHVAVTATFQTDEGPRTSGGSGGGGSGDRYTKGNAGGGGGGSEDDPDYDGPGRFERPANRRTGKFIDEDRRRPIGPAPGGKAIIASGPASLAVEGMEPAGGRDGLLEALEQYENPWDAIYDLWMFDQLPEPYFDDEPDLPSGPDMEAF